MSEGIDSDRVVWGYAESEITDRWQGADSREDAEANAADCEDGGWICEGRWLSAGSAAVLAIDARDLLERMNELDEAAVTDDEAFEIAKYTAAAALAGALAAWAEEHVRVMVWHCTGEPIRVEPAEQPGKPEGR